jgi:hypothetical protein
MTVFAEVENLDEIIARKARLATATWGYQYLQNDSNNYTWQPETLSYFDVTTGGEVWRLSYSPSGTGGTTQDIATSHWDAKGNRVLFHSTRATNAFNYADGRQIWMLSNTDGSRLKPAKGSSAQTATMDPYVTWSPVVPDVLYSGYSDDGQGLSPNVLYKVTTSDSTITRSVYLTLPSSITGGLFLKKAISADGTKILAKAFGAPTTVFPLTVYPESSKAIDIPNGYSNVLNFDFYWGGTVSWSGYHDQYLTGATGGVDGIWNLLMPETAAMDGPFWRARITGSGASGEPVHTQSRTAPYSFGGEIEPVNTVTDNVNKPSPWCGDGTVTPVGTTCVDAPGHGSPDRWGHYLIFCKGNTNTYGGYGLALLDMRTHANYRVFTSFPNPSHPDWEAWSDWSIASGNTQIYEPSSGPTNPQRIFTHNMYDGNSLKTLAYTHARYNDTSNPPYTANARPTQSPDGTKVMFNSTFLNATDNDINLFWTVAYYPYPPDITATTATGGTVTVTFEFGHQRAATYRTYTQRGWPNESTDMPPPPREIEKFRLWRSTDKTTWTPITTTTYDIFSRYDFSLGTWSGNKYWTITDTPGNGTFYYAVTSMEWSGLESKALSNIYTVTITGGSGTGTQDTAYPADPGKMTNPQTSGFYTSYNDTNRTTMIRYYNVYAKDGSAPTASQTTRIASIPATACPTNNCSWVDWLGNTDASTVYRVAPVDYQGNEGGLLTPTSTHKKSPATADGQYTLEWKLLGYNAGIGTGPALKIGTGPAMIIQ